MSESIHLQRIQDALDENPDLEPDIRFTITDPALATVEPLEFVIDGMAARGLITVIAGPPGSGKSFLTQFLLQTRSSNLVHVNPGVAFYLTGADASENEVRHRARKIIHYGHGNLLTAQLDDPDVLSAANNEAFMQSITLHLKQHNADAIIFDTIRDYYDGDSKEALVANKTMVAFRKLAEQARVAVILITHTRKSALERAELKVEDVADSRIFTSKADFVFGLQHEYRDEDQTSLVQIINLKTRSSRPIPRIRYLVKDVNGFVNFERTDEPFKNESRAQRQQEETQERDRKVRELANQGRTQSEIADLTGVSRQTVNKILKKGRPEV